MSVLLYPFAAVCLSLSLLISAHSAIAGDSLLTADAPKSEASRTVLKMETSSLNTSIDSSADELATLLNQTVSRELYKGSTSTKGLSANVLRNGSLVVTAADNFLYITLPVALSLSYGMFETKPIPLKLKFKGTIGITPEWRITTAISYLGLSDLVAEQVGIGALSIKPRSIVEGITQPLHRLLSDMITKKINDQFPLKIQVAKLWNSTQKPVLLDKSFSAWLKLTPQDVVMYPLYAQNNRVRLSVGINTFAELVVGAEPPAPPVRPLPNLRLVNTFDKSFRIALNADLFYKDLVGIASNRILNRPIETDGKTIIIKDLNLYGNGDKIVVKLQTEGSLEGVFYLTAKPVFNPETSVFSVEDVDFDMETRSLLLRSADWFLHSVIRSMIQEKLNMNLTAQLEQTRQMAGKALARVKLAERLFLTGDIKTLKFNNVVVQTDKISIRVYANGESSIVFQ